MSPLRLAIVLAAGASLLAAAPTRTATADVKRPGPRAFYIVLAQPLSPTDRTSTSVWLWGHFGLDCNGTVEFTWNAAGTNGSATLKEPAGEFDEHYAVTGFQPGSDVSFSVSASACGYTTTSGAGTFQMNALLTVSVEAGHGSITGPGINCVSICTSEPGEGQRLTLTATPDPGFRFVSWDGMCNGQGATCNAVASKTTSAGASFAPANSLAVTRSGDGDGTVTSAPGGISCGTACSAAFPAGARVVLTAAPSAGSSFEAWSGACTGSTGTCTVSLATSQTVGATFVRTRRLSIAVTGRGSVASNPNGIACPSTCAAPFAPGTSVALSATPDSGWAFVSWSGACTGGTCSVTIGHDDARVSALFRPVVTITVRKNGTGKGVVTSVPAGIACGRVCSEDVVAGTTVTFRARAAKHSRFDHWAGACAIFLEKPTCTLKLNRAAGVIAVFAAEPKR